ncbi:MAG: GspH/FimT family pseudopilin [Pseudoxanthomonas suwonensis]|nr:GspH/FimT family pseudopilin [Pseudoxanthomonas suwonensis]
MSRGSAGFSLLEVLLVMALIAAVGLLAMATVGGGLQRMQLRGAANDVAAQLRFTRAQAIATGMPQRFTIDPAARRWQAPRERSGTLPAQMQVRFTGARQLQPRAGEGAIVFFGDGASSGGRVQLQAGQAAWQVDVAWLTGQVSLRPLNGQAP